jgi:hypothetical protein
MISWNTFTQVNYHAGMIPAAAQQTTREVGFAYVTQDNSQQVYAPAYPQAPAQDQLTPEMLRLRMQLQQERQAAQDEIDIGMQRLSRQLQTEQPVGAVRYKRAEFTQYTIPAPTAEKASKISKKFMCAQCKTTTTPEKRKGPDGHRSLCNRCGIRYSKQLKAEAERQVKQQKTMSMNNLLNK